MAKHNPTTMVQAIFSAFISPNVRDSNREPANVVDTIDRCADGLHRIADAIEAHNEIIRPQVLTTSTWSDESVRINDPSKEMRATCDVARFLVNDCYGFSCIEEWRDVTKLLDASTGDTIKLCNGSFYKITSIVAQDSKLMITVIRN